MGRDTNPEFGRPLRKFFRDEAERAQLEAQNGLLQFDKIISLRIVWGGRLQFDEETVKLLHHAAIHGIYDGAGEFRDGYVGIENSKHVPQRGWFLSWWQRCANTPIRNKAKRPPFMSLRTFSGD